MWWLLGGLLSAWLILASVSAGIGSQAWAPWWFSGSANAPVALGTPVVVPTSQPIRIGVPIIDAAMAWLGVPYRFGGCDRRGVDCSCLVMLVYQAVGVHLPRVAADQFNATARISRDQLEPGDLVFFANTYMPGISHVGIYLGGGMQINAPTEGEVVAIAPVFSGYWGAHYAGAGRVRS